MYRSAQLSEALQHPEALSGLKQKGFISHSDCMSIVGRLGALLSTFYILVPGSGPVDPPVPGTSPGIGAEGKEGSGKSHTRNQVLSPEMTLMPLLLSPHRPEFVMWPHYPQEASRFSPAMCLEGERIGIFGEQHQRQMTPCLTPAQSNQATVLCALVLSFPFQNIPQHVVVCLRGSLIITCFLHKNVNSTRAGTCLNCSLLSLGFSYLLPVDS